jgi:hypothetical protein
MPKNGQNRCASSSAALFQITLVFRLSNSVLVHTKKFVRRQCGVGAWMQSEGVSLKKSPQVDVGLTAYIYYWG